MELYHVNDSGYPYYDHLGHITTTTCLQQAANNILNYDSCKTSLIKSKNKNMEMKTSKQVLCETSTSATQIWNK